LGPTQEKIVEHVIISSLEKKLSWQKFILFIDYFCNKLFDFTILDVDYCQNNACQHGGTCFPMPSKKQYICKCMPGYYGTLCEYGKSFLL
jgi:hypothetical protein